MDDREEWIIARDYIRKKREEELLKKRMSLLTPRMKQIILEEIIVGIVLLFAVIACNYG